MACSRLSWVQSICVGAALRTTRHQCVCESADLLLSINNACHYASFTIHGSLGRGIDCIIVPSARGCLPMVPAADVGIGIFSRASKSLVASSQDDETDASTHIVLRMNPK